MSAESAVLKFPREIEADPRRAAVEATLAKDVRPLWTGGSVAVPHLPFADPFEQALIRALRGKRIERGLEHIDDVLDRESKGLEATRAKHGTPASNRISRLLVMADDGAERFYRQCDSTLRRHRDRVLGLRVTVPSSQLSEKLFGADKLVKVLLVSDREAVTKVLLALAEG